MGTTNYSTFVSILVIITGQLWAGLRYWRADGSTPVDPQLPGSSITNLSAAIAASTADYTATGTELSGVYSAVIKTGTTSEALTGVIGKADGTGFVFDTGSLTGIDLNDYTITATHTSILRRDGLAQTLQTRTTQLHTGYLAPLQTSPTTSGPGGTLAGVEVGMSTIELFVVQTRLP